MLLLKPFKKEILNLRLEKVLKIIWLFIHLIYDFISDENI